MDWIGLDWIGSDWFWQDGSVRVISVSEQQLLRTYSVSKLALSSVALTTNPAAIPPRQAHTQTRAISCAGRTDSSICQRYSSAACSRARASGTAARLFDARPSSPHAPLKRSASARCSALRFCSACAWAHGTTACTCSTSSEAVWSTMCSRTRMLPPASLPPTIPCSAAHGTRQSSSGGTPRSVA